MTRSSASRVFTAAQPTNRDHLTAKVGNTSHLDSRGLSAQPQDPMWALGEGHGGTPDTRGRGGGTTGRRAGRATQREGHRGKKKASLDPLSSTCKKQPRANDSLNVNTEW